MDHHQKVNIVTLVTEVNLSHQTPPLPCLSCIFLSRGRCGRRVSYCGYMLLGGMACLLVLAVPQGKFAPSPDMHGMSYAECKQAISGK